MSKKLWVLVGAVPLLLLLLVSCTPLGKSGPPPPAPAAPRTPAPAAAPTPTPTPTPRGYSQTLTVEPGDVAKYSVSLSPADRVEGSFTVKGGSGNDVDFSVKDPFGNQILDAGRVSTQRSFAFTASTAGQYQLLFGNTFSTFSNKVVSLTGTVFYR